MNLYTLGRKIKNVVIPKIDSYHQDITDALGDRILFCFVLFLTLTGAVTAVNWFFWFIKGE